MDVSTWGFQRIGVVDGDRANRLEAAGSPDELIAHLVAALHGAIDHHEFRIATDSKRNQFLERRAIVQYRVLPELYDWFFNGRTGYRAQFWIGADTGLAFNSRMVEALTEVLRDRIPGTLLVRRIEVDISNGFRHERSTGAITLPRTEFIAAFAPDASKLWIDEQLCLFSDGDSENIGFAVLSGAERSLAKLCVPRWAMVTNPATGTKADGLRAPLPEPESSWLDMKGAFLDPDGYLSQIKPQDERARQIHDCGWT